MRKFRPVIPPPRRDVIQKFVSMVAVNDREGLSCCKWTSDRQLASHLELCRQRDPQLRRLCQNKDEIGLVQYWLELWPKQPAPSQERRSIGNHLFAYLEAPRYLAALNRFNAYADLDSPQETWASYMSIAGAFASDPDQIADAFHKYERNRETRLEKFLQRVLESKIQEGYYKERKTGKYSPWCDLKRASNKRLKEGLQWLGLWQKQYIDRYKRVARTILRAVSFRRGASRLKTRVCCIYQTTANDNRRSND